MIISHKHKFIFIKTNKTAGTSVEIALSKFCGPEDILTRITPADEETRRALGYTCAQNYQGERGPVMQWICSLAGRPEKVLFRNHISSARIRKLIAPEIWDSYFKFCVERNPWDRTISSYYWKNKSEPRPSIRDWLRRGGHRSLMKRGRGLYTQNGRIVVDEVVKFETLAEDLERVRQKIGLPEPLDLPRAKGGHRKDKRHYRDVLTEEERQIIARDFAFEIETFGYEY